MSITEKDFKRCKKGDPGAQRLIFDAYRARVMGVCRRYSAHKQEAEDVFQESFIRIFKSIGSVQEYRYLDRWIIKTTINTAINCYYKNRRHDTMADYEEADSFDEDDVSILDDLSNEELLIVINQLPDGYRVVFNLYVVEGYKHHEISKLLNISENTSKSQLSRAKVLLRRKLRCLGIKNFEKYG